MGIDEWVAHNQCYKWLFAYMSCWMEIWQYWALDAKGLYSKLVLSCKCREARSVYESPCFQSPRDLPMRSIKSWDNCWTAFLLHLGGWKAVYTCTLVVNEWIISWVLLWRETQMKQTWREPILHIVCHFVVSDRHIRDIFFGHQSSKVSFGILFWHSTAIVTSFQNFYLTTPWSAKVFFCHNAFVRNATAERHKIPKKLFCQAHHNCLW